MKTILIATVLLAASLVEASLSPKQDILTQESKNEEIVVEPKNLSTKKKANIYRMKKGKKKNSDNVSAVPVAKVEENKENVEKIPLEKEMPALEHDSDDERSEKPNLKVEVEEDDNLDIANLFNEPEIEEIPEDEEPMFGSFLTSYLEDEFINSKEILSIFKEIDQKTKEEKIRKILSLFDEPVSEEEDEEEPVDAPSDEEAGGDEKEPTEENDDDGQTPPIVEEEDEEPVDAPNDEEAGLDEKEPTEENDEEKEPKKDETTKDPAEEKDDPKTGSSNPDLIPNPPSCDCNDGSSCCSGEDNNSDAEEKNESKPVDKPLDAKQPVPNSAAKLSTGILGLALIFALLF